MKRIIKFWGEENIFVNSPLYCCKHLIFHKNYQCSLHYHKIKDETFYIVSGKIKLELNGRIYYMKTGDKMRIKPNSPHRIFSPYGKAVILEVSTKDRMSDSYRIEKSKRIEKE